MKSKIAISIPKPCHENWDAMTQAEKGRFCGSCQKQVFDFTKTSDRMIAEALNEEHLCGRFNISQLNRDLIIPKEKNPLWMTAAAGIVAFLGLGTNQAVAQGTIVPVAQTDLKTQPTLTSLAVNNERIITGKIISDTDKQPIPGVSIIIENSENGVQTDFDGNFAIHAKSGDTLTIRYVGMKTVRLGIINSQYQYNILLKEDETVFTQGMLITYKRRTFFGRIFHAIGNIFR